MPPAKKRKISNVCAHKDVAIGASPHASECGYNTLKIADLWHAATGQKKPAKAFAFGRLRSDSVDPHSGFGVSTGFFPAPLILPDDELAYDPDYPPQDLVSWEQERHRNPVTSTRNTIYIATEPDPSSQLKSMRKWSNRGQKEQTYGIEAPEVIDFIEAFYYGMQVKHFEPDWEYVPWDDEATAAISAPNTFPIGLANHDTGDVTRIRVRDMTKREQQPLYSHQLNLTDLLDVAIRIVPKDAYCVLLLSNYDLYEDDPDDFCCGRAYGGSRVAVVSTARYHPDLDESQDIDRGHSWPASHCVDYIKTLCGVHETQASRSRETIKKTEYGPLRMAVDASNGSSVAPVNWKELKNLWLARVCRTAAHELGHCFGIDHCVFYACMMQGTASMIEDVRQPPYLCPVDLAKVVLACTAVNRQHDKQQWNLKMISEDAAFQETLTEEIAIRYRKLTEVCLNYPGGGLFDAFAVWLRLINPV